jgi:carbon monoxide dehydrogenase subunit G
MQVAVEAFINAPPDAAFRTAADIADWPRFISAIDAIEVLSPGAVGVGTRFRETRAMFGRKATEEMTVAAIEPPRRLVLTARNHGTAYRAEHSLAPEGVGTRLTLTFEGRPVTLLARLLVPIGLLFMGTVKRQLESDLADLKREAERRHELAGGAR